MELMENQRNNKLNNNLTREAYRKKDKKLEQNVFSRSNFILPNKSPSKANIL